ncbi:MAG: hypothetical protein OEZ16_00540 [Chromatiales bacterium]|nr:hypothetical protein [Chromatiales bacterium]
MSEALNHPEIPPSPNTSGEEAALAAAISIHYITMVLYVLGFIGTTGSLLLSLLQRESENYLLYAILCLLPVILFLMHLMALKGLKKHQPWGYRASRGLGILLLFGFPFGTVLGLFLLSQLSKFRFDEHGEPSHE